MKRKAKQVQFTSEHMLFIWKRFRYIKEIDLAWYFNEKEISQSGCCVEIRNESAELIACGTLVKNNLEFSAVAESERGKKLQCLLIKKRLEFLKENTDYKEAEMNVRCQNVASWKNALNCGFRIKSKMRFDNDDEGFLLTKEINH